MTIAADQVSILLVDDLPEKILVLETILADLGATLVAARSGAEALQHVLAQDFAVILMDVNMPGMDGLETAALIRRRKKSSRTPIIFVTAFADDLRTTQGYSLGAVDYILSPIVPDFLRTKVSVFVDLHRMTLEVRRHAEERVALAREQAAREAAERSEAAVRASEERFRLASDAVTGFIYERDLATDAVTLSPGVADLLGISPDDARTFAWWTDCVLPEDRPAVEAEHTAALAAGRTKFHYQYRVCHRDGRVLHVWDQGIVVRDPAGTATRVVGNVVDVTDQKHAEQALADANRRKDEFLSMLAHELRNPLAPIRNVVQIMRMRGPHPQWLTSLQDIVDRNVTQLVRLVDDLLDVSRITLGKIRVDRQPVDLAAVVHQAIEISGPVIEARLHELTVGPLAESFWLSGDATRLTQIVANLLNNAAKYTDEGGRIWLTMVREGREAVIRVRDTGVGLPPEMLEAVFEPFAQVERSLDRAQGGLGIGLTLARRLVDLHDGRIVARSDGPGRGSEFEVRLPLTAPTPATSPAVAVFPTRTSTCRVLVVDDNQDAAETLVVLIQMLGNEVRMAHTGPAALDMVREFLPDIVVLDIGLPGMDGYEVARQLRRRPETAFARLVALTGYGQAEDRARALDAGFDLHLVKPVDPEAIQSMLSETAAASNGYK